MYCPTCGSEERQLSQYCRACGTDLRSVRLTLEKLDPVTASAVTARDRISQAVAEKIREAQSATELHKVAEDVLPEIEKFLESPEERRLRRVRTGVIISFIGCGAALGGAIASMQDESLFVLMVPGIAAFFIGLALILNGLLFTVTKKKLPLKADEENQLLESLRVGGGALDTAGFSEAARLPAPGREPASVSVTEHTTKHLGRE